MDIKLVQEDLVSYKLYFFSDKFSFGVIFVSHIFEKAKHSEFELNA